MAHGPPTPTPQVEAQLAALGSETHVERNVKRILPWVISVAIHLCIACAAVFVTWTVANLPKNEESVLIVADFNAMQYDPVAAAQDAPAQALEQPVIDLAPPAPSAESLLDQLRASEVDPMSLLEAGNSGSASASLANFAPRADSHAASFAGTSATNARKICYVIDATGSMIAHLQIVIDELTRSLSNLSPQQSFAIIFFQGNAALEPPPGRYLTPTAAERQRALEWARTIVPAGLTNPRPAIERALNLKPDVLFLLSHGLTGHGEFEIDQRELLEWLDARNPIDRGTGRRAIQINCIQFLDPDPLDTMKRIAQAHGGPNGYKFLSRRELGVAEH
jgi:hypothetical protein